MTKDPDAAYLAAILDMKASFSLNPVKRSKSPGTFSAHLTVTTRSVELVEYFNSFGSKVLENNGSFRVYWNYQELRKVLLFTIPFMRFQREQAEVLLQFLNGDGIPHQQSERIKQLNYAKRQNGPKEFSSDEQDQTEMNRSLAFAQVEDRRANLRLGGFDILSQDMFGNPIWIECVGDIATAQGRINELSERCPKGRFVIWDHQAQEIVLELAPH
jgi:hypothetical protein